MICKNFRVRDLAALRGIFERVFDFSDEIRSGFDADGESNEVCWQVEPLSFIFGDTGV